MADTHEEQLLSGLLDEIARQDAALDASDLEARVIEAVSDDSHTMSSHWRVWLALPLAAALMLALAATMVRPQPEPAPSAAAAPTRDTTVAIDETPPSTPPQNAKPVRNSSAARQSVRGVRPQPVDSVRSVRLQPDDSVRSVRLPPSHKATADQRSLGVGGQADPDPPQPVSPIEFVPLLPMTEQELTGSFQIVRVQMPNASLGPLRSPLQSPNDLVEADVLLGEDGRARAIRVNMNQSIYPWRLR